VINLKSAICPGCAQVLPVDNKGCSACGYEDNTAGRILTLEEIIKLPAGNRAHTFNDVSPAFIAAVVAASQAVNVEGWKVEFENGAVELHLGESEPTVGRWITALVAGSETIDLAPDSEDV